MRVVPPRGTLGSTSGPRKLACLFCFVFLGGSTGDILGSVVGRCSGRFGSQQTDKTNYAGTKYTSESLLRLLCLSRCSQMLAIICISKGYQDLRPYGYRFVYPYLPRDLHGLDTPTRNLPGKIYDISKNSREFVWAPLKNPPKFSCVR